MHEQDTDTEPAHHARRPMNAFLIFCKRHRSVVREKYPNLENRSITKILGEWWANLDKEEKACYTGLAKQYKDAFFSANPDFKWYKLPAPPLRTLSSRPREPSEKAISPTNELYHEIEPEKVNNNSTKVDFNKKPRDGFESESFPYSKPLSMFTPGKLADEAQMGGLSRLLDAKTDAQTPNPYYSPFKFTAISTPNDYRSHAILMNGPTRDEELQNALSETTRVFEDFDENKKVYRYETANDRFTNQDVIDQIVDKRYYKEDEYGYQRNWSDDERNTRSGRSCKGKRYQEFMAVGGLIVNKRQKRDYSDKLEEGYGAACSWEAPVPDDIATPDTIPTEDVAEIEIKETDASETDNNQTKTFKAADFDLDAKIAALPSLSLEKFQQRKRENKRKKKTINLKPKVLGSSHIVNSVAYPAFARREMAEGWREQVIGSQKRKPRKISITRLEVARPAQVSVPAPAPAAPVAPVAPAPPPAELFALATLAEVASSAPYTENASTVLNTN